MSKLKSIRRKLPPIRFHSFTQKRSGSITSDPGPCITTSSSSCGTDTPLSPPDANDESSQTKLREEKEGDSVHDESADTNTDANIFPSSNNSNPSSSSREQSSCSEHDDEMENQTTSNVEQTIDRSTQDSEEEKKEEDLHEKNKTVETPYTKNSSKDQKTVNIISQENILQNQIMTWGKERVTFAQSITLPCHPPSSTSTSMPKTSWSPLSGTTFFTRSGPNYTKYKTKKLSAESLYETIAVRFLNSDFRMIQGSLNEVLPLPEEVVRECQMEGGGDVLQEMGVPQVLVVHMQLPYESPNVFKAKNDGKGGEVVLYLKPSQRFLNELTNQHPTTPATKLFTKWCQTCETDPTMRKRFKCMASVRNIDKFNNLGMLKTYNGKPVLITESGFVKWGVSLDYGIRYLEMSANVHSWSFMAKKGFVSLIPKFQEMRLDVGMTIEACEDDEMPECILGAVCMNFVHMSSAPLVPQSIRKPVTCSR